MFKAYLKAVAKRDDRIITVIEFQDDKDTTLNFEKEYEFNHMVDLESRFEETVIGEVKRINDLDAGFETLKLKIGAEIKAK